MVNRRNALGGNRVAKIQTGIESQASYLRRLAIVFADELRLKIVTELYMREMSPSRFYEEFGGGSVSRVDRHFKRLAEHGWLKFVRKESGGSRRGATEHFYRATELAVFDHETWSLVPYSVRVAFSWRTFRQLAERVQEALRAGTLDARDDSHLSWTPLLLDRLGWERVVAAVDALFESLFDEQADAKLRLFQSEEKPILATAALSVFESPARSGGSSGDRVGSRLVEGEESPIPFPLRVSKVFADPLCLKIVAETNLREMSAPQFHGEFGGASVSGIRRRFKMLAETAWLKKVNAKTGGKRRGATEHFYRATGPAIFDKDTWTDVPDSVKATYSWRTFEQLSEQVKVAIEAGTFEARTDNHLSWSLLRLDQQGWERVTAAVDTLFAFFFEEQESAKHRLASSGEKPISTTVALAAFESPKDSAKAP
jgi:DNA-binding transcriptional ArsR family regulator